MNFNLVHFELAPHILPGNLPENSKTPKITLLDAHLPEGNTHLGLRILSLKYSKKVPEEAQAEAHGTASEI